MESRLPLISNAPFPPPLMTPLLVIETRLLPSINKVSLPEKRVLTIPLFTKVELGVPLRIDPPLTVTRTPLSITSEPPTHLLINSQLVLYGDTQVEQDVCPITVGAVAVKMSGIATLKMLW